MWLDELRVLARPCREYHQGPDWSHWSNEWFSPHVPLSVPKYGPESVKERALGKRIVHHQVQRSSRIPSTRSRGP
eukprot:9278948-Heterocapsa_arctica.AAC.1